MTAKLPSPTWKHESQDSSSPISDREQSMMAYDAHKAALAARVLAQKHFSKEAGHEVAASDAEIEWRLESVDLLSGKSTNSRSGPIMYRLLYSWEGAVVEVLEDSFIASLKSLTSDTSGEEVVEIEAEALAEEDLEHLSVGSLILWSIGNETNSSGQTFVTSRVRVRRLRTWSERDEESFSLVSDRFSELFEDQD